MPNTLAHFGAQGVATRALIRDADPRWIFVACVIPDIPWILQRVVSVAPAGVDPYSLRLYAVAQASLLVSLLLCGALAALAKAPGRAFGILALGALLHLVLDALQTKWGNGVHIFAPFSWELWNQELFWPEHPVTYLLTAFGLVYIAVHWLRTGGGHSGLLSQGRRRLGFAALLLGLYLAAPLFLMSGPEAADNHSVRTLRAYDDRPGRHVEFDRATFVIDKEGRPLVRTLAGEMLKVKGDVPAGPTTLSVRGRFLDETSIEVQEAHDHAGWPRDLASYVGLMLLLLIWTVPVRRPRRP